MNNETKSVVEFFKENPEFVLEYIEILQEEGAVETFSYSGMLMKIRLTGTTKDDVDFQSSRVSRGTVSRLLKEHFKGNLLES